MLAERYVFGDRERVAVVQADLRDFPPSVIDTRPAKPRPLAIRVEGIPEAMKAERRWVVWRYEYRKGKWTKTPCIATAVGQGADSTDARTWRSFAEALAAYTSGRCDGIGFVLGDGWIGFDADGTDATELVAVLDTYTERSPSGNGVHAIAKGVKPGDRCRVGPHELYGEKRYFTVTGHHVEGTPTTVEERSVEIATVYALLFPEKAAKSVTTATSTSSAATGNAADDALLAKARAAKNGAKFAALWAGDISSHPSHSEADLALCSILAFWTNRDAPHVDGLFRKSGLMREKWDSHRGDSTYGADVVTKAIEGTPKGYTGEHPSAPTLIIRKASEVPDEHLDKIFGGRLVRGSITLLAGPGEAGKGMCSTDIFARLTTGAPFPGETRKREPIAVMICVTEDSVGRVKSRLRAAGADLDMVYFVEGPEMKRGGLTMPSPMMLDDDAGTMVKRAKELGAQALFLETVVEHFGDRAGKVRRSTNNEADVRSALSPFRAVCATAGLYGLGAIHPRKSMAGGVDDSISGSAAFRNVTRAAHHIYRDPADDTDNPVRLLFTSKSNYLSRRPPTLRFRVVAWNELLNTACDCAVEDCTHEGRVLWEEGDELIDERTAQEIWQQIAESDKPRNDVSVQKAEEFLAGLLEEGDGRISKTPNQIYEEAKDEGIGQASVRRAKEEMKLVSVKDGFPAKVVAWAKPAENKKEK